MTNKFKNITHLRRSYELNKLKRKNLPNHPIDLFSIWLNDAYKMKVIEPNAMCIATVDQNNQPYQRTVLLKHFDYKSIIFFTNMNSRKANHLEKNKNISLLFNWHVIERQVMMLGYVKKLSHLKIEKYFKSRPRNSQISAWASNQSSKINSRVVLEKNFSEVEKKFQHYKQIPLPSFWGGYNIKVSVIEFWQGRQNRLHDRFIYQLKIDNWEIYRLSP